MDQANFRFQIVTAPTKKLTKEGYRNMMWRSWRPIAYGILIALILWQAGQQFYLAFYWNSLGWKEAMSDYLPYGFYFLLLAGAAIGIVLVTPTLDARRYMKRLAAVHSDVTALNITYYFDEEDIHIHSSTGADVHTAYGQIISVWETAHGIVLRWKLNMFEILDKDRIEGGTLEDFKVFLQEKMPSAKFHWKQNA